MTGLRVWRCAVMALSLLGLAGARGPALSDDLRSGLSNWRIEAEAGAQARVSAADGVMDIDTPKGLSLWWRTRLHGPVAIEYDVMAVSRGGPNDAVSDVNAFWMATDPRAPNGSPLAAPRSGAFADYDTLRTYYVGIGGNRNTTTRLRRYVGVPGRRPLLPGNDRADSAALLAPNRWTHVRLIASGHHIAAEYDHKVLFTLEDPAPYRSGWFAIRTTKSHLRIRNFRIHTLGTRP